MTLAAANAIISRVFRPVMNVGQIYARPYGILTPHMPIGNVLELGLEHSEQVLTQPNMTQLGGGVHSEVRRVQEAKIKMKIADLNLTNLARACQGTLGAVEAGTVTAEAHTAQLGGLLRLKHMSPTAVTVKKGEAAETATAVTAAGNYEVRPEGIYLLPTAEGISNADKLWVGYSFGAYAVMEALTTKAVELDIVFGGLNEADSGNPQIVEIFRASQGVTSALALLNSGFAALDVTGTVLMDATKTGVGISKYYKVSTT